eukprot:TRINITY_DN10049_c0_g3_i2.p1 TRINITY_DN10049_c0_g3~~TRINITY_DN10049_c0_g3_i2.p1  ORF type:complete len:951 (-),score=262.83 TRINITY_DN10049_c0_g3_i2:111-2678(-)
MAHNSSIECQRSSPTPILNTDLTRQAAGSKASPRPPLAPAKQQQQLQQQQQEQQPQQSPPQLQPHVLNDDSPTVATTQQEVVGLRSSFAEAAAAVVAAEAKELSRSLNSTALPETATATPPPTTTATLPETQSRKVRVESEVEKREFCPSSQPPSPAMEVKAKVQWDRANSNLTNLTARTVESEMEDPQVSSDLLSAVDKACAAADAAVAVADADRSSAAADVASISTSKGDVHYNTDGHNNEINNSQKNSNSESTSNQKPDEEDLGFVLLEKAMANAEIALRSAPSSKSSATMLDAKTEAMISQHHTEVVASAVRDAAKAAEDVLLADAAMSEEAFDPSCHDALSTSGSLVRGLLCSSTLSPPAGSQHAVSEYDDAASCSPAFSSVAQTVIEACEGPNSLEQGKVFQNALKDRLMGVIARTDAPHSPTVMSSADGIASPISQGTVIESSNDPSSLIEVAQCPHALIDALAAGAGAAADATREKIAETEHVTVHTPKAPAAPTVHTPVVNDKKAATKAPAAPTAPTAPTAPASTAPTAARPPIAPPSAPTKASTTSTAPAAPAAPTAVTAPAATTTPAATTPTAQGTTATVAPKLPSTTAPATTASVALAATATRFTTPLPASEVHSARSSKAQSMESVDAVSYADEPEKDEDPEAMLDASLFLGATFGSRPPSVSGSVDCGRSGLDSHPGTEEAVEEAAQRIQDAVLDGVTDAVAEAAAEVAPMRPMPRKSDECKGIKEVSKSQLQPQESEASFLASEGNSELFGVQQVIDSALQNSHRSKSEATFLSDVADSQGLLSKELASNFASKAIEALAVASSRSNGSEVSILSADGIAQGSHARDLLRSLEKDILQDR